jgi:ABC-2 type transport system ATP-binding protein
VILAENLAVTFRGGLLRRPKVRALQGFSLHVNRGDIFALLGPNGAGKSTAMYCFLGLIRPERGRVTVLGEQPKMGSASFQRVAYLPEEPHYHLYLSVEEAVTYYGNLYVGGVPRRRVLEVIDEVGLMPHRKLALGKCSKGMRQKAGIAACLLRDVDLLFLDEPTRGLDPVTVNSFRQTLRELNARGTTIVINSHVLSEIEMLCNRVAVIDGGRVLAQEDLANLLQVDLEWYAVSIEAPEMLPDLVVDPERDGSTVRGKVAAARLPELLDFTSRNGLKVLSCAHQRLSLEQAFMSILENGR